MMSFVTTLDVVAASGKGQAGWSTGLISTRKEQIQQVVEDIPFVRGSE